MRAVLFAQLPESVRRSLAPSLPFGARGVVLFDVPARIARRFGAAINVDGVLVLSREVPRAER